MMCVVQCIYKKKKLEGKSFLIIESLTGTSVDLFKEAQGKYGIRNVWTTDGRILYKKAIEYFFTKISLLSGIETLW